MKNEGFATNYDIFIINNPFDQTQWGFNIMSREREQA